MRIQTNVDALNAYRNLVNTNRALSKSLERLSSGFRINRAADDAAGLAISEKMRGQVRGLNQAARNAQDGISLIQTAEGSLNETHAILQRMRELAVQAANDTLTANDRQEIQKEVDQLRSEIDRIANTTEFNTKKLLDGTTSALVSSDRLETKVFMRDGLRVEDQFGQKAVGGGNFRLDIVANPGTAQIQKTDIFKIKHEGAIVEWTDVDGTHSSPAALQAAMKEYADLNGITINLIEGEEGAVLSGTATYDPDDGRVTLDVTIAEDTTVDALVSLVDDLTVRGGLGAVNEVQNVRIENASGGTFLLSYDGAPTAQINYNASVTQMQNRLESIDALEGNVLVTGSAGNWNIEFINDLAAQAVELLTLNPANLIDPTVETNVTQLAAGSGGQSAVLVVDTGVAGTGAGVIDGGYFTLTIGDFDETGPIAYAGGTGAVVTALNEVGISASTNLADGSMAHVAFAGTEYTITLQGELANQNVSMNADLSGLKNDANFAMPEAGADGISAFSILDFTTVTGGTFEIGILGETDDTIAYNATADAIQDAIWDMILASPPPPIPVGAVKDDVVVNRDGFDVTIDFVGALARQALAFSVTDNDMTYDGGNFGAVNVGQATGTDDTDAQSTLTNNSATGGTFTIAIDGFGETGPINFSTNVGNMTNNIRNALTGMTATTGPAEGYEIRSTDINVGLGAGVFTIDFVGGLGNLELNPSLDLSNLEYTIAGAEKTQTQAGQSGTNQRDRLYITGAGDGTFRLTVDGLNETVVDLDWNATADEVRSALEGAHADYAGNVEVTGKGTQDNPWIVEWINDLGASDGPGAITFTTTNLDALEAGGTVTVSQESVEGAAMSEILAFNIIDGDHVIGFNPNTYTTELNEVGFREGLGEIAQLETAIYDIDRFWDASGNFIVDDPQTITLVQGDGTKASFTIFRDDTIEDVVNRIDAAIRNPKTNYTPGTLEAGKGLGQGRFDPDGNAQFAYFVEKGGASSGGTFDTVEGTIVINSAIAGKFGEIKFVGDEDVIKALSLTTIRQATENRFTVDVINAHSGAVVAQDVVITSNILVGVVHTNVDVEFDPNADIAVKWEEEIECQPKEDYTNPPNAFYFESKWMTDAVEEKYSTFVHLADSTMVFHIGANPLQDVGAAIGDMRARALGVHNTMVIDRESANASISQIDRAIDRVSAERSKLGALQNRLEHTISNLAVASENLSAAESRIRDVDMAAEMMEFTKNQILAQAGTAMLAQANMKPQMVLQLLG